jgi:hypothetical protein
MYNLVVDSGQYIKSSPSRFAKTHMYKVLITSLLIPIPYFPKLRRVLHILYWLMPELDAIRYPNAMVIDLPESRDICMAMAV